MKKCLRIRQVVRIHDESRCFFREKGTQWLHRISAIVRARSIERSPASSPWSLFIAIIAGSPIVRRNLRPCLFRGKIFHSFKFSQSIKEQCFIELREYLTRVYIVCSALLSVRSFLCFLVWYLCTPYTMDAVLRPFLRSFSLSLLPIHLFLSSSISHSFWRCCCFVSFSQAIRIRAFSRNQFPAVSIQFLVYIRSVQCV